MNLATIFQEESAGKEPGERNGLTPTPLTKETGSSAYEQRDGSLHEVYARELLQTLEETSSH